MRIGIIQMCSTENVEANLKTMIELGTRAVNDGAQWIAYPENCLWLSPDSGKEAPRLYPHSDPFYRIQAFAKEAGVWVLLGSIAEASPEPNRVYNTSVLLSPTGEVTAHYRKCFLFDVDIKGRETHQESARVMPGNTIVSTTINEETVGLSICYDLRFPELYRRLSGEGATILTVPAAFTSTTGRDHWEVLLRARAIENQCFVIAPDQWGHHGGKRRSHGRSMVISPWGVILAQVEDGEGVAVTTLDFERLHKIRQQLPCLQHQREDIFGNQ